MKRTPPRLNLLKQAILAVTTAVLMLSTSHAAQIGINFEDEWGGDGGATVVDTAFGLNKTNWFNMVRVLNSESGAFSTNQTITLPDGGTLLVEWSAVNTYSVYADIPTTGDEQVTYGYLDDTGAGYKVAITGFRNFASGYSVTFIASSDSAASFADALVAYDSDTNTLQYLNPYTPNYTLNGSANPTGLAATSTVSSAISALKGNHKITITGTPESGSNRSSLAGIIIDYTPGGKNPPEIVADPQPPTKPVYSNQSFSLEALASGSPTLGYQWRKNGTPISGETGTTYTKSGVSTADNGNYDVVVTNSYGVITSAVAVITISPVAQPTITRAPVSQTFYQGYPATFTVEAAGGQLAYQWKKGTTAIPAATNASLTLPSVAASDAATYTVKVSNPIGSVESSATLVVNVPTGAYESAVAVTKPLVWFRYSETEPRLTETGSAANSGSAGSAAAGVAKRYVSFQQPGAIVGDGNKSARFSGNQMVDVPFDAALNPGSFTAELWVNPSSVGTTARSPLYNRGANTSDGFLFFAHNATTKWQFRTYVNNSGTSISSTVDVVAGVWTHLVGVFDATSGLMHFYVNGVEQGTGWDASGHTSNSSVQLRLGAGRNDLDAGDLFWEGGIDEVAIYSTVLSPAEIVAHYQNATNASRATAYDALVRASAPVGYWRLDEPAGPTAPAPKNSGTAGAAWAGSYGGDITPGTVGPRPPSEPGLESTNAAVTMSNGYTTTPQLTLANNITVACWMKREAVSTTGDLSWPAWLGGGGMHLNNGSASTPEAELRYHWNGGEWGWGSGLFVPAGVWTFCAMVVETNKATFYMSDGTILKSSVHTVAHAPMAVTSQPGFGANQPGRGDRNFIGQLDETTVYDRALTQGEINTLFMSGTGAILKLALAPGGVIEDSNPSSTKHHGYSFGASWVASSLDTAASPVTRSGVEQFSAATPSQITIPAHSDFNSTIGTICFWMRANAPLPGPGTEGAILVDRRTSSGAVIVLNDAGSIFVQCSGGANSFAVGYLPDDTWHHVAVTYDQSAVGSIAIYLDGALAGSQANTAAWSWLASQQIELGRSHDGYWRHYDGLLDDFRIYNRVLTEPEIGQVLTSGSIVDTAALKLRFNFDTLGIGESVIWPFGTLETSPTLKPGATWTPVSGATSPYPFLPTEPSLFFRARP